MSVKCEIKDYKIIKKKLDDMLGRTAPKKVLERTLSDVRTRAPGWVAAEVVKVYGVKKSEITGNELGKVKVTGNSMKNVSIKYTGRMLTHTHFGMSPTAPKEGGGAYTLKATIVKGERATLGKVKKLTKKQRAALSKNLTQSGTQTSDHSPIMLMRAKGGHYLPFQRKSTDRKDVKVIKAISLPQMVSSERTHDSIQAAINEKLGKRLDQHMKLLEK